MSIPKHLSISISLLASSSCISFLTIARKSKSPYPGDKSSKTTEPYRYTDRSCLSSISCNICKNNSSVRFISLLLNVYFNNILLLLY